MWRRGLPEQGKKQGGNYSNNRGRRRQSGLGQTCGDEKWSDSGPIATVLLTGIEV